MSLAVMNRRGTEPYARWCERPEGATPPAYSIERMLPRCAFDGLSGQSVQFAEDGDADSTCS